MKILKKKQALLLIILLTILTVLHFQKPILVIAREIPIVQQTENICPANRTAISPTTIPAGQIWCIGANINGNVTVQNGATLFLDQNYTITGTITVQGGATFNMSNGRITGNSNGVVVNTNGRFNMTGGVLSGNGSLPTSQGVQRGAIWIGGGSNPNATNFAQVRIGGSAIIENNENRTIRTSSAATPGSGSAINIQQNFARVYLEGNAKIRNNINVHHGAIFSNWFNTFISIRDNVEIYNNHVINSSGSGPAVKLQHGGRVEMHGGLVHNNTNEDLWGWGGGFTFRNGGTFVMTGGEISNNAGWSGAAVQMHGNRQSAPSVSNTSFRPGDYVGSITITGGRIANNVVADRGGAIHTSRGVNINISGVEFQGNRANGVGSYVGSELGGAISAENASNVVSNLIINNSLFKNNIALSAGAINIAGANSLVIVEDSEFISNLAIQNGGAMMITNGTVTLNRNNFIGNEAAVEGGALFRNTNSGALTINGGVFTENVANNGGAISTRPLLNTATIPANSFMGMTIDDIVIFTENVARSGYFMPPLNWEIFTEIQGDGNSTSQPSLINNYDIRYTLHHTLTKNSTGTIGSVGEPLKYTLTIHNPNSHTRFVINDVFNPDFVAVLADTTYVENGTMIEYTLEPETGAFVFTVEIEPFSTTDITFYVIPLLRAAGNILTGTAHLYSNTGVRLDSDSDSIPIKSFNFPDLEIDIPNINEIILPTISINADNYFPYVGEAVTYTVVARNENDGSLFNLLIRVVLEPGMERIERVSSGENNFKYIVCDLRNEIIVLVTELAGNNEIEIIVESTMRIAAAGLETRHEVNLYWQIDENAMTNYELDLISSDFGTINVRELVALYMASRFDRDSVRRGYHLSYIVEIENPNPNDIEGSFRVVTELNFDINNFITAIIRDDYYFKPFYYVDHENELIIVEIENINAGGTMIVLDFHITDVIDIYVLTATTWMESTESIELPEELPPAEALVLYDVRNIDFSEGDDEDELESEQETESIDLENEHYCYYDYISLGNSEEDAVENENNEILPQTGINANFFALFGGAVLVMFGTFMVKIRKKW